MERAKEIILSFDVEQDAPPYLHTFTGIKDGLPKILAVLREKKVNATLFTTGEVAEKFPEAIENIVRDGHELGSHGYDHKRFDRMDSKEAKENIAKSMDVLLSFYDVVSFRAPNLKFPMEYYGFLEDNKIRYDSSQAIYKGWKRGVAKVGNILVIPVTVTSIFFRLPKGILERIVEKSASPVVLFSHPWEYSGVRVWRPDLWWNAGDYAVKRLSEFIDWAKTKGYRFKTVKEWGDQVEKLT